MGNAVEGEDRGGGRVGVEGMVGHAEGAGEGFGGGFVVLPREEPIAGFVAER